MNYPRPLVAGTLLRRYKRFLADVEIHGERVTVHCPNTGAMTGCDLAGSRVWCLPSDNPKRKYPLTWELVESPSGALVCVHSARANRLVGDALAEDRLAPFAPAGKWRSEVPFPDSKARCDFACPEGAPPTYIEVKAVTLAGPGGQGWFPDAPSVRAHRQLATLATLAGEGVRAVLVYVALRNDVRMVAAARDIDPRYADAVADARAAGVEVLAWSAEVGQRGLALDGPIPVA